MKMQFLQLSGYNSCVAITVLEHCPLMKFQRGLVVSGFDKVTNASAVAFHAFVMDLAKNGNSIF